MIVDAYSESIINGYEQALARGDQDAIKDAILAMEDVCNRVFDK